MTFALENQFNPDVQWYTGQGCLNCGRNKSAAGEEFGHECVDLGVDIYEGRLGLCTDCARQVGLLVGMVALSALDALHDDAREQLIAAETARVEAMDAAAQVRLDKDTLERLLQLADAK